MEASKHKILIVEDALTEQVALKRVFGKAGFDVSVTAKGEEAVQIAASEHPQVAVIDTLLPDIDGFETCRRIRSAQGDGTKIIINTGNVDAVDAMKAREAGADDYVVKTSSMQELLSAVKKLLG